MTNSKNEIPVIDISPFLNGSDKKGVAEKVTNACKNIGFLIISGHGIEPTTVEDAFRKSRQFFNLEQKKKNLYHPQQKSQQRGYHAFATRGLAYTLGRDAPPDLRETYSLGPLNDHKKYFQASIPKLLRQSRIRKLESRRNRRFNRPN